MTLTGPGGTGKTRLSLQIAAELIEQFADGVYLVNLAPIADPALVPSTIAHVLGVREMGGRPILESLNEYLREKQLLLVLDNFEQVLPAASARGRPAGRQLRAEGPGHQSCDFGDLGASTSCRCRRWPCRTRDALRQRPISRATRPWHCSWSGRRRPGLTLR